MNTIKQKNARIKLIIINNFKFLYNINNINKIN